MGQRVIIYRRFSSDEQGGEGRDSLSRQLRTCERYAESEGWLVTDKLTDRGRSAYLGEHLLPDAELGRFLGGDFEAGTIVIAERLDRLSRRPVGEAMAWLYSLVQRGLQIAIADKRKVFDRNMGLGDFIDAAVSFNTGNEESSKKSERVTSAKQSLWANAERRTGRWTNLANRPPLWLKRNETCDDWVIDKDRMRIIQDVYQWSADGLGAVAIAGRLNSDGVRPWGVWRRYDDGKWSRTSVATLLDNPAVEGDFVARSGIFLGKTLHGFYPRVVDADVVSAARDQMRRRKRRTGEWGGETRTATKRVARAGGLQVGQRNSNLFAGKTFCETCGQRAFLTTQSKNGRSYTYLRCESASSKRCSNNDYYPYAKFETSALDLCIDLALDDHFFEATGELRTSRIRKAELEKNISDRMKQRGAIILGFGKGDAQAMEIAAGLQAEITEFEKQLGEVSQAIERHSGRVNAVEHLRRVTDIREAARSDDPAVSEQARAKLRTALSAVMHSVSIGHWDGEKIFTMTFRMGTLGVQFRTDGSIKKSVTRVDGKPLWEFMPPEHQAMAASLVRRIEQHGTLSRIENAVGRRGPR